MNHERDFGLLISLLLPGFIVLLGMSHHSATIQTWIGAKLSDRQEGFAMLVDVHYRYYKFTKFAHQVADGRVLLFPDRDDEGTAGFKELLWQLGPDGTSSASCASRDRCWSR